MYKKHILIFLDFPSYLSFIFCDFAKCLMFTSVKDGFVKNFTKDSKQYIPRRWTKRQTLYQFSKLRMLSMFMSPLLIQALHAFAFPKSSKLWYQRKTPMILPAIMRMRLNEIYHLRAYFQASA